MITTTHTTLIIFNVKAPEMNFARFVTHIRLQGETEIIARLIGGATRNIKTLMWEMIPVTWNKAIVGTTYEHMTFVEDTLGNKSPETVWVTETAGDTTPPDAPATFTLESTIATAKCSFPYTDLTGFDRFEWIVKYDDNSNPAVTDIPTHTTNVPEIIVGGAIGQQVSFWVRAIDQSGNINTGNYIDCGDIYTLPPSTFSNLLGNGGFDRGLAGWDSDNSNFQLQTSGYRTASFAVKIVGDGTEQTVYWSEYFPVKSGDTYYIEAWFKETGGSGDDAMLGVTFYNSSRSTSVDDSVLLTGTGSYQKLSKIVSPGGGRVWARIFLRAGADVVAGRFMWFDDFVFRKVVKKVYDGTAERLIGTGADNIPLIDTAYQSSPFTTADGKLPQEISKVIAAADDGTLILRIGNGYLWHDGVRLRHGSSPPASSNSASGTVASANDIS